MLLPAEAQQEVADRITASEEERKITRDSIESGHLLKANIQSRIEKRKVRLLSDQSLISILGRENRDALAGGLVSEAPEEAQQAFEVAINGSDTQPCWFLTRGVEIRKTVGRIHVRNAHRRFAWGTGFLVAPNLLLTNQHVLDSLETARFSRVEFDFEETFSGETLPSATFDLLPETFYVSDPARGGMDYALVAVSENARPDSRRPEAVVSEFGCNVLVKDEGKLVNGELIYCIHHPEGQARQVNLRENRLTAIDDPVLKNLWMHYETDTEHGSSGAPLFNYEWVVVGIHHMAVEKRNDQGNILAIGGDTWTPSMGERKKWWQANEGLRISRFIKDVEDKVRIIMNSDVEETGEHRVTDEGFALFELMLKPTSNNVVKAILGTVATPPSTPTSNTGGFRPE